MRMSPTPCDRSVSPNRVRATPPVTPNSELSTIEKLQARVWLSEEELNFSTKMQMRSEVEVQEWGAKLRAMRQALEDAQEEHKRLEAARPPPGKVPLSAQELEEQAQLEKLKQKIAEIGEKRQETVEEIESVRNLIHRSQTVHEKEHGGRTELVAELAVLEEKYAEVTEQRQLQEHAFNEYEASREGIIAKEVSRIEQHVMSKLDAILLRRDQAQGSIKSNKSDLKRLESDYTVGLKEQEDLKVVHSALEAQLLEKQAKSDDYDFLVQGMLSDMEESKTTQAESAQQLQTIKDQVPAAEAELQLALKIQRKENISLLTQKALLLEGLGEWAQAKEMRYQAQMMNLRRVGDSGVKYIDIE